MWTVFPEPVDGQVETKLKAFEFVIEGTPISQQAKKRRILRDWKNRVHKTARKYWPQKEAPMKEKMHLTLTYFYADEALDVDNMIKPVLDAMIGIVYLDDSQITDIYGRKRKLNSSFRIHSCSPALARGLSSGLEFLHVKVEEASYL